MEYAKDEIFQIKYNTNLSRIYPQKENWIYKIYRKLKQHKLLTTILITLLIFFITNIIMINSFMKILVTV